MKNIILLGSTGSIGESALDVVRNLAGECKITGLTANKQWKSMAGQIKEFEPAWAALADSEAAGELAKNCGSQTNAQLLNGVTRLADTPGFDEVDIVLSAIMGAAGLESAIETVENKKTLAIANKETLVMAGEIIMPMAKKNGAQILPVDSEHSAILQSMRAGNISEIKKVTLTASGGPFYDFAKDDLPNVTPAQALKHPTWEMGRKITIDSATLMNKALEIIEAKWLFDLDASQIEVVVHPQSIIHSMVEFCDGSTIAQMGTPDMKVPIQFALTYPDRKPLQLEDLDLAKLGSLTFKAPNTDKFPALALGFEAAMVGGTMGSALNAANEVAVEAFLDNKIKFTQISELVKMAMEKHTLINKPTLKEVIETDAWAREEVNRCL